MPLADDCERLKAYRRENPAGGVFVSPRKVSEAYSSRATAHMNDHNYDDAVRDYRAARDYMQQG